MKHIRISNTLLSNAYDLMQSGVQRCQVTENYIEYYVKCCSGRHGLHVVTQTANNVYCDCDSYSICKHALASAGRSVLALAHQSRWATDREEVEYASELHAPAILLLPEWLRVIARNEVLLARQRLEQARPNLALASRVDEPCQGRRAA